MKFYFLFLLMSFLMLSSCTKEDTSLDLDQKDTEYLMYQSGRNDFSILVDDHIRDFIVHVPTIYDGSKPVPLLFMLHGSSGTGEKFWNITSWKEKAEQENFIVVFPTALEYPIEENHGRLTTKWSSAGLAYEVPEGTEIVDDIPFFYEMIRSLEKSFNLDSSRYYISGFSNGGGFVKSRVMIEMTDKFAAVSSAGGLGYPITLTSITSEHLPLFNIVGSLDAKVLENVGNIPELPLNSQQLLNNEIVAQNITNVLETLQLESVYSENPNQPSYNILTYGISKIGKKNEYIIQLINDMEHNYPNGKNNPYEIDAVDFLWPWFMKFQKEF